MKSFAVLLAAGTTVLAFQNLRAATVLDEGETDLGIGYEDGAFHLHVHHHDPEPDGTEYEPEDAILTLKPGAAWLVPNNAAFTSQLGAAGTQIHVLPKDEQEGLLALGIGSEELSAVDWVGNLTYSLKAVSGPGSFYVWDEDSFGDPTFLFNSDVTLGGGITGADSVSLVPGGHNHFNFGFSAPGDYQVTVEVTGTHAIDGLKTAEATYSFSVQPVPEPASGALLLLGGAALLLRKRRVG